MSGYSTLEEIQNRRDPLYGGIAKIVEIEKAVSRTDCFILIFRDGSQANCNGEVYNQLK